MVTGLKDRRWC